MVLLFIGPSGSGKDTQAELLRDKFGYNILSSGQLFRDISSGDKEFQKMIRDALNEGFIDDDFVYALLKFYLKRKGVEGDYILTGVVRYKSQIPLLDQMLESVGRKLDKVLYFEVDDEEVAQRLSKRLYCTSCNSNYILGVDKASDKEKCDKCGGSLARRVDDNPDSIKNRLKAFYQDADDIASEYEKRGILLRVDASDTIQNIHEDIVNKLSLNK